jgi:hypothetical protein
MLDLLPSSGKKGEAGNPGLRLAQPGAQQLGFLSFPFLPEYGRRSTFQNVVKLFRYTPWRYIGGEEV